MERIDSKSKSFVETITDITVGFLLFLPVNFFVLPLFVNEIANHDIVGVLTISGIYSAIAIARKFILRRWFENMRRNKKKSWYKKLRIDIPEGWWRIPNI